MFQGQLSGPMGTLTDPATGRQAGAIAHGRYTFTAQGDPNAYIPQINAALVQAAHRVIAQKLAQNQVAIPTLAQSLPYYTAEIIQASGVQQMGVQIQQLELNVQLDWSAAPAPQLGQQQPQQPQYEVRASLNIGGFNLKASSDKGFDAQGLADQATDKVRSEVTWWIIGAVVVGIAVLGAIGMGIYIYLEAKKDPKTKTADSSEPADKPWDGKEPLTCAGNEKVVVKGVKSKLDKGIAIKASGNCKVELDDVDISAPTALLAEGNAVITVKGGSIEGKDAAAKTTANGKIKLEGTKVTGKKDGAKIEGP